MPSKVSVKSNNSTFYSGKGTSMVSYSPWRENMYKPTHLLSKSTTQGSLLSNNSYACSHHHVSKRNSNGYANEALTNLPGLIDIESQVEINDLTTGLPDGR